MTQQYTMGQEEPINEKEELQVRDKNLKPLHQVAFFHSIRDP